MSRERAPKKKKKNRGDLSLCCPCGQHCAAITLKSRRLPAIRLHIPSGPSAGPSPGRFFFFSGRASRRKNHESTNASIVRMVPLAIFGRASLESPVVPINLWVLLDNPGLSAGRSFARFFSAGGAQTDFAKNECAHRNRFAPPRLNTTSWQQGNGHQSKPPAGPNAISTSFEPVYCRQRRDQPSHALDEGQ